MKILHILSQMPDFTGSGKTIQAIIGQAEACGHKNFLLAGIHRDFEPDPRLVAPAHSLFVRFSGPDLDFPLPGMSDVMPYKSTVFSSMTADQLARYRQAFEQKLRLAKETFDPDIIHTHHLWIVSKIARQVFADRPMVTSCHGTCLRQYSLCPHIGPTLTGAVRRIDRILCLSRHQKNQVQEIHGVDPENVDVVGAGFNSRLFGFDPHTGRDAKPEAGPVEMVYAGKLSRAKGVPWLLGALKRVSFSNWRLHLAGSGSGVEKEQCLELADALGDRVVVHGPLSHDSLARLMKNSHLFVLPSFFEGLPLVIMEALSSGCRILTTALPGTREILGDISSPMVRMIPLPPLETVDTPFSEDMPDLERLLAQAIETSLQAISASRQPDMDWAGEITRAYTWERVFSRMEAVYRQVGLKG